MIRPDRKALALGGAVVALWAAQATVLVGRATTDAGSEGARPAARAAVGGPARAEARESRRARSEDRTERVRKAEAPQGDGRVARGSRRDGFRIDIEVRPSCLERGESGTVVVQTTAKASVALVVAYSDGQSRGTASVGEADRRGAFRYGFVVPPDAPEGMGRALVAVRSADAEHAGDDTATFVVAGAEGCDR